MDPRPRPRDPFGPPLDGEELRALFRRLEACPFEAQAEFVARLNWNLLDFGAEHRVMVWLAAALASDVPERQGFALKTLDKLPHPKRGRHASLFAELMPRLDDDLRARLAAAFGPVLGGPRKPSARHAARAPEPATKAASADDLARLKAFFGKSGGALAIVAAVMLTAEPARADYEYWGWYEARVPLPAENVQLRLLSDLRYGLRYPGLGASFFRVGPLFHVAPWCFIGTHATTIATQSSPGALTQEHRAELEPNFHGRLGDFTWNDRNRLEYRWRPTGQQFRYRNQLRVNWAPPGARWIPFVWEEAMIELNAEGFAQNRAELGIGHVIADGLRLDLGTMLRSRATAGGWEHDMVLNSYLYWAP